MGLKWVNNVWVFEQNIKKNVMTGGQTHRWAHGQTLMISPIDAGIKSWYGHCAISGDNEIYVQQITVVYS